MPEGPEIRRVANHLAETVRGQPLEHVWFAHSDLQPYAAMLRNSRVSAVKTKGKALLTEFDCGLTVYSHNQLYGRWYFVPAGRLPKTNRQLRWQLQTPERAALLYSASEIRVLDEDELANHPFLARAGLDILSDNPDLRTLKRFIGSARFARRGLGALLLDQSFIAGTGNYLRSEILFVAGLRPEARPGDLDSEQIDALARAIRLVTRRAYESGGVTAAAALVRRLKSKGWSRSKYRHFVFARADQPCHQCGAPIEKQTVAGRRLYLCPVCQPA